MNIVLVHGILGFRERFGVEYFRGIAEYFRAKGLLVLVPELDQTRGIEFRGNQLADQINSGFKGGKINPEQQTHIIAHSMGGLDSRYVLSPASGKHLDFPVKSLTTISTPHRGSPIADLIDKPLEFSLFGHLPFGSSRSLFADTVNGLGISLDGLRDLTTASCAAFSNKYENNPSVSYFSVAGVGRNSGLATALALMPFHQYITGQTGRENDGLVTDESAMWETFDPSTWPADHAEEVGHNLDNLAAPPAFQYLPRYDQIVSNLTKLSGV